MTVSSAPTLRWGILGPGGIAASFADDLARVPGAQLVAVGSRNRERAVAFAARRAIPYAHGSYEALAADPAVDIIYIATPHSRHAEDTLLCLEAGKHVLVEKPFTVTVEDAQRVAEAARNSGRFVMEAIWTRFFPLFNTVRELIISGRIGSVTELRADFGNVVPYDPTHRLWSPSLAGGALLDLGVYPLTWAVGLLGWPQTVEADASFAPNGVDEATGVRLVHEGGAVSLLHVSLRRRTPNRVVVEGTNGRVTIAAPLYAPRRVTVSHHGDATKPTRWTRSLADLDQPGSPILGPTDRLAPKLLRVWESGPSRRVRNRIAEQTSPTEPLVDLSSGHGYRYEAEECGRCIAVGLTESPVWTLGDSVRMMRLLGEVKHAAAGGAAV